MGKTPVVATEAEVIVSQSLGSKRPDKMVIIHTESTREHAELAKRVSIKEFGSHPWVELKNFPKEDLASEEDFLEFVCFVSKILSRLEGEKYVCIGGGRKIMALGAYLAGCAHGAKVFDIRVKEGMEDHTRVSLEQIDEEMMEERWEDVRTVFFPPFNSLKPIYLPCIQLIEILRISPDVVPVPLFKALIGNC